MRKLIYTEEELKLYERQALKRARITSIILGLAAVITVLSVIYGTTQSIEAGKQSDLVAVAVMNSQKEIIILKEQLAACQAEKK